MRRRIPLPPVLRAAGGCLGVLALLLPLSSAAPVPLPALPFLTQEMLAFDPTERELEYGFAVAVDGDTVVVGSDSDAVYVYRERESEWALEARLEASDGEDGDAFGSYVDIEGDTLVVGALHDETQAGPAAGSAYVFRRDDSSWSEVTKLTASDGRAHNFFGYYVAISQGVILVGAPDVDSDAGAGTGAAYVYESGPGGWEETAKLVAPDPTPDAEFGRALALSGGTALIGAPFADSANEDKSGAAYVFTRTHAGWAFDAKLEAPDGRAFDNFGFGVGIDGDVAVAGAQFARLLPPEAEQLFVNFDPGAAYAFERAAGTWSLATKLQPTDFDAAGQAFGRWVAASGDRILVGAPGADLLPVPFNPTTFLPSNQGAGYAYERGENGWELDVKLVPADGANEQGSVGFACDLDGARVLLGAPHHGTLEEPRIGRAYLLDLA